MDIDNIFQVCLLQNNKVIKGETNEESSVYHHLGLFGLRNPKENSDTPTKPKQSLTQMWSSLMKAIDEKDIETVKTILSHPSAPKFVNLSEPNSSTWIPPRPCF